MRRREFISLLGTIAVARSRTASAQQSTKRLIGVLSHAPHLCGSAGRWLAARQHSCNWREEIAAMKAGRHALGLPVNVPTALLMAFNQLE